MLGDFGSIQPEAALASAAPASASTGPIPPDLEVEAALAEAALAIAAPLAE